MAATGTQIYSILGIR